MVFKAPLYGFSVNLNSKEKHSDFQEEHTSVGLLSVSTSATQLFFFFFSKGKAGTEVNEPPLTVGMC